MSRVSQEVLRNTLPLQAPLLTAHNALAADLDAALALLHGTNLIVAPVFSALEGDDTVLANTPFTYRFLGVPALKAAVTEGTAFPTGTIPSNKWGSFRISVSSTGTITLTKASGNGTGYATEALALAAVPAVPTGELDLGTITLKTAVGQAWVAGTDAIAGGSTGNPASVTTFTIATPAWTTTAHTAPLLYG